MIWVGLRESSPVYSLLAFATSRHVLHTTKRQSTRGKGAKDLSGQGWWPIVETGGADGAGLEEVHGRASPSKLLLLLKYYTSAGGDGS
ncbi:hypothetical protein OIU78_029144 [Salix suchowensis]|nr:hypothetical protein OIU78_029144 [Salix suchowensis]